MIRAGLIIFASLLCLLVQTVSHADVKGRVRISLQDDKTAWVGQQLQVNLDLLTTGYRFSDAQFNLPQPGGAFLMQTDTTTIKLTESINGES